MTGEWSPPAAMRRGSLGCTRPCLCGQQGNSAPRPSSSRGILRNTAKNHMKSPESSKSRYRFFEKSSIDEFYIDLTGMDRFFGCFKLAQELRQRIIRESGLNISMGLSENKTVSKVATGEAKPNNEKQVPNGQEKPFLAPLSVRKIPMIGEKNLPNPLQHGRQKKSIPCSRCLPNSWKRLLEKTGR